MNGLIPLTGKSLLAKIFSNMTISKLLNFLIWNYLRYRRMIRTRRNKENGLENLYEKNNY